MTIHLPAITGLIGQFLCNKENKLKVPGVSAKLNDSTSLQISPDKKNLEKTLIKIHSTDLAQSQQITVDKKSTLKDLANFLATYSLEGIEDCLEGIKSISRDPKFADIIKTLANAFNPAKA